MNTRDKLITLLELIKKAVINIVDRDAKLQSFIIEGNEFDHYSSEWAKRVDQYYR